MTLSSRGVPPPGSGSEDEDVCIDEDCDDAIGVRCVGMRTPCNVVGCGSRLPDGQAPFAVLAAPARSVRLRLLRGIGAVVVYVVYVATGPRRRDRGLWEGRDAVGVSIYSGAVYGNCEVGALPALPWSRTRPGGVVRAVFDAGTRELRVYPGLASDACRTARVPCGWDPLHVRFAVAVSETDVVRVLTGAPRRAAAVTAPRGGLTLANARGGGVAGGARAVDRRTRVLVRMRALCLADRATASAPTPAAWLCTQAPMWVFMRVCELFCLE